MSALARVSLPTTSGRTSPAPKIPHRCGVARSSHARLPRRSSRVVSLATTRDETPDGDGEEATPKRPTLREASEKFSEDFWDEVGKSRGGVPMLRRMNEQLDEERDAMRRGDADPSQASSTAPAADDVPSPSPGAQEATESIDPHPEGFWRRCTIGGLLIAAVFWWWGLSGMHWPTARWVATHPNALLWSDELGWSVAKEVALRLGAPLLRCVVAWCAMRSHWRVMAAIGAAAFACPVADV